MICEHVDVRQWRFAMMESQCLVNWESNYTILKHFLNISSRLTQFSDVIFVWHYVFTLKACLKGVFSSKTTASNEHFFGKTRPEMPEYFRPITKRLLKRLWYLLTPKTNEKRGSKRHLEIFRKSLTKFIMLSFSRVQSLQCKMNQSRLWLLG